MSLISGIKNFVSDTWDTVTGAFDSVVETVSETVESGVEAVKGVWDRGVTSVADTFGVDTPDWLVFSDASDPARYAMLSGHKADEKRDEEYWEEQDAKREGEVETAFAKAQTHRVERDRQNLAQLAADGLMSAHTAQISVNNRQQVLEKSSALKSTTDAAPKIYGDRSRIANAAQKNPTTASVEGPAAPSVSVNSGDIQVGGESFSVASLTGSIRKA